MIWSNKTSKTKLIGKTIALFIERNTHWNKSKLKCLKVKINAISELRKKEHTQTFPSTAFRCIFVLIHTEQKSQHTKENIKTNQTELVNDLPCRIIPVWTHPPSPTSSKKKKIIKLPHQSILRWKKKHKSKAILEATPTNNFSLKINKSRVCLSLALNT